MEFFQSACAVVSVATNIGDNILSEVLQASTAASRWKFAPRNSPDIVDGTTKHLCDVLDEQDLIRGLHVQVRLLASILRRALPKGMADNAHLFYAGHLFRH